MTPEQSRDDADIQWGFRVASLSFSTTVEQDEETTSQREAEAEATDHLIEALQNGDVEPRWTVTTSTQEQRDREAAMDDALRCPNCGNVNLNDSRELVVDDDILYVCLSCADDLTNTCNDCKRTTEALDDDEAITVVMNREVTEGKPGGPVSEFLCTTCAEDA